MYIGGENVHAPPMAAPSESTLGNLSGTGALQDLAEQPLTPDLLQHIIALCRKNGFTESEEALSREANAVLRSGDQNMAVNISTNENIMADFASLLQQVEASYDFFQAEFALLIFPVFAHSFLKLLYDHSSVAARLFFDRYHARVPRAYEEQLVIFSRIHTVAQAQASEYVQLLLNFGPMPHNTPFVVKLSKSCIKQLDPILQRNATLRNIVKERLMLEPTDVISKLKSSVECQMGGILGQVSKQEKKHKMYYGVLREDNPYFDKRRVKGKDGKDKKREPYLPMLDRIPIPPVSEALRIERTKMAKDAQKMTYISAENPPSVCFFTALNANGGVTSYDVSDDSVTLALGMGDSMINLYTLDETQKLKRLKDIEELEKVDTEADNLSDLLYDENTTSSCINLAGHSGPVYSVNYSPCKRLLLSSGADATVRLWSMDNYRNVVMYRTSKPIWQVQFSPRGYYFCTGGADKTASLWVTDRMHPVRIFPDCFGHVSCVDFHPNCNYIAGGSDDKYVRVWDVLSGTCVRMFSGHKGGIRGVKFSPCGRYIVSVGGEGAVCVWDLAMQRLAGMETRTMPTIMSSISFTREGDAFAVSHGTSSITIYSLEELIRASGSQSDMSTYDPKINMEGFQMYHYASKHTPVIGLHWTRRNLLLGIGAFLQ